MNCSNGLLLCHFHSTLCGLLYPFCRSRFTHFSLLLLLYYVSLSLFGAAWTATANCVRISKFNFANTSSVSTFLLQFFVATRCDRRVWLHSIEFFAFTFLTSGFGVGVGIDFFAQKLTLAGAHASRQMACILTVKLRVEALPKQLTAC